MKYATFVIGLISILLSSAATAVNAQTTTALTFGSQATAIFNLSISRLDFAKLWQEDFEWGVLAINPDKAVYLPGETAFVTMGVLDEFGMQVCDAILDLEIWGPNDYYIAKHTWRINEIVVGFKECSTKGYTDKPDFHTTIPLGEAGEYDVRLTARTKNGEKYITDKWFVQEEVPLFSIQRHGPTRTYPTATYTMRLDITPLEDFKGEVIETMPSTFKIPGMTPPGSVRVRPRLEGSSSVNSNPTVLTWEVDWQAGKTYTLLYQFQSHGVSPDFLGLGPLTFKQASIADDQPAVLYQELRPWQIANDDTTGNLFPTADGTDDNWTQGSTDCTLGVCATNVDSETGAECSGGTDGDGSDTTTTAGSKTTNERQSFDIDESSIANNSSVTSIRVDACHTRSQGGPTDSQQTFYVNLDGTPTDGSTVHSLANNTWVENTETISVSYTKTGSSDIEIGVIQVNNKTGLVTEIWADITYTPPAVAPVNHTQGYMMGLGLGF